MLSADATHVARAMADSVLAVEAVAEAPDWLLPEQRTAFRRALAAIDTFGGALLAEPTGAGKTWIALAAAAARSELPAVCIVPAAVAEQWQRIARRVSVSIIVATHERASRGTLPAASGLVVIDESHRFRNPGTRRYVTLARWLVGQRALLLTATPAVNRLADLVAQLRLVLPDDALVPWGVPSIRELVHAEAMPQAAAYVIVRSSRPVRQPSRRYHRVRLDDVTPAVELIDTLSLSKSAAVANLVRGVLLRAAASSTAAFLGAVRRYRLLLLHAGDAAASGAILGRAAIRSWVGSTGDQIALWPLLGDAAGGVELELTDRSAVEAIERNLRGELARRSPRAERLMRMLTDGRRTLVFTAWRDTARWLRDTIGPEGLAWCMGSEAGIGRHRSPRDQVLACFAPGAPDSPPWVLITTDVASEGLDLQAATRVVHYDLPWTPMRLAQRDGRAARLGNPRPEVDVVRFDPPAALDFRLRQTEILRSKGTLPQRAGLAGAGLDRWREVVESAVGDPARGGIGCVLARGAPGILVCVGIRAPSWTRTIGDLVWLDENGESRDPGRIAEALGIALTREGAVMPTASELSAAKLRLADCVRGVLRRSVTSAWTHPDLQPDARKLANMLGELARHAARQRDGHLISLVDHGLRFTARGHTAGEELVINELSAVPQSKLAARLAGVPASPARGNIEAVPVGAIIFRSASPPLRSADDAH